MNCQTKLRINHLTAVKSVAILESLDIGIIGIPMDIGTSNRPGTRFGPRQIRTESSLLRPCCASTGDEPFSALQVADLGDIPFTLYDIVQAVADIKDFMLKVLEQNCIPITLGGEHTISYPILQAMKEKHGPVGLVHIDAHADVSDSMMGCNVCHETPFKRAFDEGAIDPKRVVQIGLRGTTYTPKDYQWGADEERALLVKLYYQNGNSATKALRKFRSLKRLRKGPLSSQGLTKMIRKFEATGTLGIQSGRKRKCVAAHVVNDVVTQMEVDRSQTIGSTSVWCVATFVDLPRSTVHKILRKGFKVILAQDCWHTSMNPIMEDIRKHLGDGPVYMSLDIDSLDPCYAPGTGTPEIGGLTSIQVIEIIRGLQGLQLVGGDVVEDFPEVINGIVVVKIPNPTDISLVSPPYDLSGNTSLTAANLVFEFLTILARNKKGLGAQNSRETNENKSEKEKSQGNGDASQKAEDSPNI
ncbi:agmatinase, mitochondrial [Trichonephila clavipes]|nr:agmatinase, mitochondrial [Trichonephila clavipes]